MGEHGRRLCAREPREQGAGGRGSPLGRGGVDLGAPRLLLWALPTGVCCPKTQLRTRLLPGLPRSAGLSRTPPAPHPGRPLGSHRQRHTVVRTSFT